MPTRNYRHDQLRRLSSPRYASKYLKAALDDGDTEGFLLALRNVVDASQNRSSVARKSRISRQHLYRLLDGEGNPTLNTLKAVLSSVGLDINFQPEHAERKRAT